VKFQSIELPEEKIAEFCRQWKITEFALFGSVLRDDFRPDSDIDVLVTFADDCGHSLFDLVQMQEQLKTILAHEVDLVEKAGLRNPFRRHNILNNMEVIYAALRTDMACGLGTYSGACQTTCPSYSTDS